MVDVEEHLEEKYVVLRTDKRTEPFFLEKDRSGYAHFVFRTTKSQLPECLQGKFTSIQKGIDAFKQFDRSTKQSVASRQEELQNFREKRRGKPSTKGN